MGLIGESKIPEPKSSGAEMHIVEWLEAHPSPAVKSLPLRNIPPMQSIPKFHSDFI
jgi:hypothetical protein